MHDDFQPGIEDIDEIDGATPQIFRRVFIAGEPDTDGRRDAVALTGALAERAEAVSIPDAADLIVIASAADGVPGRVTLGPADRELLEGAHCPVVVAPRGLAAREGYGLRQIEVGIDGTRGAAAALGVAARLAVAHDSRLRLIAVAELSFDLAGKARPASPVELERLGRHLEHAGEGLPGLWVEKDLREGVADQILVGLSRESDLLVIGSRATYGGAGRVALGDLGARIMGAARCPALVVPAP